MKTIKNIIILLSCITILLVSCKNGLNGQGFLSDPDTTNDAPSANILGLSELASLFLNESDDARFAAINSNYVTGIQNQWVGTNSYVYAPGDFDGLWTTLYVDALKPARIAKSKGTSVGDDEMVATAELFESMFLIELASSWGDVPDTEAAGTSINPAYDSQSDVIDHAIDLLNDAISLAGGSNNYLNDGIGGTYTNASISVLANTLKARAYMIKKDYPNAQISAENGIQSSNDNLMGEHSASIIEKNNAWYQFLVTQRPGNIGPAGSYLEAMLNPSNVSVSRSLVTPGDANRYNYYYSSPTSFNTTSGIFAADAATKVLSFYENKLIEAEARYRNNDEPGAQNSLNEVRDALSSEFGGSFPHSTATGTTLLKHILEEKYISIFPSPTTFHDLARTNNLLGVTPKTGTSLPGRFLYTQTEIDSNSNTPNPIPGVFDPTPLN